MEPAPEDSALGERKRLRIIKPIISNPVNIRMVPLRRSTGHLASSVYLLNI
jgi:hypothetical protein